MRERLRSDRGASIFMLAISLFLLIGASAIAVDIAAIWLDRSTDQKVTDAAAAVGVLEAMTTGGQSACETALTYVAKNTADLDSIDTSGCTAFSGACVEGAERELPVTAGRYDLTVVYPVPEDHELMTSGIVGQQDQALHEDDGEKDCERVGVRMASTRNSLFAQVLGFSQGRTTVHTVAKRTEGDPRPPFNLLVLDRTGCNTITVGGGGGIIADAVIAVDKDTGVHLGLVPGIIAADSDGSGCSGSQGVIGISGAGSLLRSDGGVECPTWTGGTYLVPPDNFTAYEGCGQISVFAPGTPGCNLPACSVSGGGNEPVPPPTPLGSRYTRKVADYRYNCYSDYTNPPSSPDVRWASPALTLANQQDIDPCPDKATRDPYIYDLIQDVGQTGQPGSLPRWTDLGYTCNPSGSITIPSPGVVVNCGTLQITTGVSVTINGNAVFNGNVTVNGSLTVNPPVGDQAWVFFRNGRLSKSGSGRITFMYAMVYLSKTSDVKLTGGSGALVWKAPLDGRFEALALWSDSPSEHAWSGQATLDMAGIFFMPWATASYQGNGVMQQTNAQWIAWRVSVGGNGALRIAPPVGNALEFRDHMTILIR
ncbi:MAG TPA: hypothetical protein VF148_18860 [Acidimicrobiia bacterium]